MTDRFWAESSRRLLGSENIMDVITDVVISLLFHREAYEPYASSILSIAGFARGSRLDGVGWSEYSRSAKSLRAHTVPFGI